MQLSSISTFFSIYFFFFFFFNDTATTEIYTLSLHDALPICSMRRGWILPGAFAAVLGAALASRGSVAQTAPAPSHVAPGAGIPGPLARVTWSNQVVRLLQKSCQNCHHDGGIAPFPLVQYQDAWEHRTQIQIVTSS